MAAIAIVVGIAPLLGLPVAAAVGLGILLAAALARSLGPSLRQPLLELRQSVRALRAGRDEARPRPDSRSELGRLAAAIDADVETLRSQLDATTDDKQQLEAVLAAMVEGVLVLDRDGRIVLANPRLRELLDVWSEVEGRLPLEVVRNTEIDRALHDAAESDSVLVRELSLGNANPRTLLMHAARVGGAGERSATVAVFHDVSEVRRLDRVRRDFIANASHELRTPLTSIQGYADTLLTAAVSDSELRAPLQAIVRNSQRLGALIDDLLSLSRIESRKDPLHASDVDVAHVCHQLAEDAALRLRDAGIDIRVDLGDAAIAWADQAALEQIISNLLDNAIKYTTAGGTITLAARRGPQTLEVRVEDTGVGIPLEHQTRIFERFYRVDEARSRALGGTGLGLAIVKHLVQAMGGEIRVESASGKGSCFSFTLPLPPPVGPTG